MSFSYSTVFWTPLFVPVISPIQGRRYWSYQFLKLKGLVGLVFTYTSSRIQGRCVIKYFHKVTRLQIIQTCFLDIFKNIYFMTSIQKCIGGFKFADFCFIKALDDKFDFLNAKSSKC